MKRVVITGMGAITPLGLNVKESWASALTGVSGLGSLTQTVLPNMPPAMVCQVRGFDPETVMSKKEVRRLDRYLLNSAVYFPLFANYSKRWKQLSSSCNSWIL